MITREEIKNLAMLARIGLSEQEMDEMANDFQSILGYVDQLNSVDVGDISAKPLQSNVARADANPNESGSMLGDLIAGAPDAQDGFYKVPKIL